MMGWDYFVPESYRKKIDGKLADYFINVRRNVDDSIRQAASSLKERIRGIFITSLVLFVSGFLWIGVTANSESLRPLVLLSLVFVTMVSLMVSFLVLMRLIDKEIGSLVAAIPFRAITTFLTQTERGPMAGLGMIFLISSFYMRSANLVS